MCWPSERRKLSDALNVCFSGSLVVGTGHEIPTDLHIYRRDRRDLIGCNRLWCTNCRAPLKCRSGFMLTGAGQDKPISHVALYETDNVDDWALYVAPIAQFRTYYCKCSWISWPGLQAAGALDSYNIDDWTCAGHPKPDPRPTLSP